MRREEIERGVVDLVHEMERHLPADQAAEMISLAKAGEPGVALENLCTQLLEYDVTIDASSFFCIQKLYRAMQLDETCVSELAVAKE